MSRVMTSSLMMKKLRGAIMVSQGQRQFEGIPKEDSGAEKISSYNGGNNQILFEHTRKQNNSPDRQFTDSTNSLENRKLYSDKDNLTTPEVQGILENENDSPVQNCSPSLFLGSKINKARGSHPINDELSKLINAAHGLDNSIMVDMEEEEELSSFELSKDCITQPQVHLTNTSKDTCNSTIPNQNDCSSDDCLTKDNGSDGIETSETTTCTPHDVIQDENCENAVYMTSQSSTSENPQLNHIEISCGSQLSPASRSSVYTSVRHSADSIVVSGSLQRSAKAQHLTLDSESQLLLSGVQTIPEQLPLILTEGDDEEQVSLNVMAGTEQLQAVSTQAVLGSNLGSGSSALMVLASTEINPSGHLIPIGGTNLLVLQSIDGQGQLIPPNSIISVTGQSPLLRTPSEQCFQIHVPAEPVKPIGKQYRCPQDGCTKIAPTSSKLKLHMLSHTGERPHKCPLDGCEWAFTTAYKLKRHIRGHTGERPFICEINDCGKCFTTTYNLKTHQKAHIREQVNVCSFENCEQSFSTLHKLKVHEKKHQLENELHTCNEEGCGKQFKSLSNYNAHCKTHNGERPHACTFEGCGKRFTKASKLKLHVRTHTGERPFICEDEGCDWSFTSAYKLKRHMRKHTGERPFTCQFTGCGKSFTRASHMRTHALSHTGQKPFTCPMPDCLKGFTAASSLNIHIRKHSGDKPFKCGVEGCGKAYTTGANLRLHQKRHEDKTLNEHEAMEKEDHVASDHPRPVHYVEIGGVSSVLESDPNSVPTTPYSVMHAFTGEDFGTEDVASLTVVQFSSEETFPPQTPVSTLDSSSGICFQFSSSDTYANPPHSSTSSSFSGLSFTAGTPLPSPGAHYTPTNIAEVDVEASEDLETTSNERQYLEKCSHDSCPENTTGVSHREYIVREQPVGTVRALNGGGKDDEDLTLPTMVVFASSGVQPTHSLPIRSENDVETNEAGGRQNSESTIRHLTMQQPCETSSIAQFAPPAIIFQGEEVKTHEGDVKINYSPVNVDTVKETERSDSNMTNHCRQQTRSTSLPGLPVSSLSLNLSSLSDDIDKSPGSPFITDVDHALDHESTINLQDLR